jgi:hypothetical protein
MTQAFEKYQVGVKDRDGELITEIIAKSGELAIYAVGENVKTDTGIDDPAKPRDKRHWEINAASDALHSLITRVVPKGDVLRYRKELGLATFNAFSDSSPVPVATYFADVRRGIESRAQAIARLQYLLSGILTAVCLTGVAGAFFFFAHVTPLQELFCLGAIGSLIGSVTSICSRGARLELDVYADEASYVFQGSVRALLGLMFGLIFVAAVEGGVFMASLANNSTAIFAFAILAGFSETFVPEVLGQMRNKTKDQHHGSKQ